MVKHGKTQEQTAAPLMVGLRLHGFLLFKSGPPGGPSPQILRFYAVMDDVPGSAETLLGMVS